MSTKILESNSIVLVVCLLLRWCVSLYPYSGAGLPPMFGDYEAQRHWQEVTVNLPVSQWYTNSSSNDLLYWGLDYPPLTAYHSFLNGKVAVLLNPDYIALERSRGYESYLHKLFMRYTVFIVDLLIFVPAVFFIKKASESKLIPSSIPSSKLCFVALLANPSLYLIDYGHFQYNNFSLGLFIAAVAALISDRDCLGSVLFSLALNYKQMELYHALPIFFYLLGKSMKEDSYRNVVIKLVTIGGSVLLTFAIVWSPYLVSLSDFTQVLNRVFPINRGLFEDKVASIWCSLSVLIKFKNIFENSQMALICLLSTTLFSIPSCIHMFQNISSEVFKYSLVNVSFVFFLFSYHVHEKSILLVTVPACLLYGKDPVMVSWLVVTSVFSMLPLLSKDGLVVPCLALTLLWVLLNKLALSYSLNSRYSITPDSAFSQDGSMSSKLFNAFQGYRGSLYLYSMAAMSVLALVFTCVQPPSRYPDLFSVFIALVACAHFILFAVYFHYRQFTLPPQVQFRRSKKLK